MVVGELALTGGVRPSKGILPIALRAKADGKTGILVPAENAAEAAVVSGLQVIPVQNLREAAQFLEGEIKIAPVKVDTAKMFDQPHDDDVDFAEVKGQENVKRALEIAAAVGTTSCSSARGHRQIHARQAACHDPAAAVVERSAGDHEDSQHCRTARAGQALVTTRPFRAPASHCKRRRAVGRQHQSNARRNFLGTSRRFVSGRTAGVQAQRAGNDAPAARRRPRHDFARGGHDDFFQANLC